MSTLFSIIIPTYNRSALLERALKSIFDQKVEGSFEVIIVDDGSSDDTGKIVKQQSFPNIFYFYQENQGQSSARNSGVAKARGAYIIFMDDDDYWLQGHLQNFEKAISDNRHEKAIFRTGFLRLRPNGKEIKAPNYDIKKHLNPVRYAAYNMCALVSLCIPSEYLQENHSPVGFPYWEDTHLILRLFVKYPLVQLETYTYVYVIHPAMGSLRNETENMLADKLEINLRAIEDFFNKYGTWVAPFLPESTFTFLEAEKYIEYANQELTIGSRKRHWAFFKKSICSKMDFRLWKHYVLFVKYLILR